MFTAATSHHLLFLLALLATCSCATSEEITPLEQEPVDETQYVDLKENPDLRPYFTLPGLESDTLRFSFNHSPVTVKRGLYGSFSLRRNSIQGTLVLRLYINETGDVDYAAIENPVDPKVDRSLQRDFLEKKFIPGRLHRQPVKSVLRFSFNFDKMNFSDTPLIEWIH